MCVLTCAFSFHPRRISSPLFSSFFLIAFSLIIKNLFSSQFFEIVVLNKGYTRIGTLTLFTFLFRFIYLFFWFNYLTKNTSVFSLASAMSLLIITHSLSSTAFFLSPSFFHSFLSFSILRRSFVLFLHSSTDFFISPSFFDCFFLSQSFFNGSLSSSFNLRRHCFFLVLRRTFFFFDSFFYSFSFILRRHLSLSLFLQRLFSFSVNFQRFCFFFFHLSTAFFLSLSSFESLNFSFVFRQPFFSFSFILQ